MQYIMDGIAEEQAKKEEQGITMTETLSQEFEADYDKISQLKADIDVFETKLRDYKRIEKETNEEFEGMVKKLAALQIAEEELDSIGWKKISSILTGKFEKKKAALDNDKLFAQVEMNAIKMNIQANAEKVKSITKILNETRKAFKAQRKYMLAKYGEDNRFEVETSHKNVRVKAVIKEIDEAVESVNELFGLIDKGMNALNSESLWDDATDYVSRFTMVGGLAASIVASSRYQESEEKLYMINATLPLTVKEIKDVLDAFRAFRTDFPDDNPFEDLGDESDIDHPINFIRANLGSIQNKGVYGDMDCSIVCDKLRIIRTNLIRERTLISKEMTKEYN